jgi:hypothetical protein
MKRFVCFVMILLCVFGMAGSVSAQSGAEQLRSETAVSADGNCTVTISATVSFDEAVAEPVFPIPADATDVTLNGTAVHPASAGRTALVNLKSVTGGLVGTHSVVITYRLENVVTAQKEGPMLLTLPILSGFAYPISTLSVTVTLPGSITAQPDFTSGYYQNHTEQLLEVSVSGAGITVVSRQPIKDHETLTMTLPVDESMFPQTAAAARVMGVMDLLMVGSIILALAYYVLALRPSLPRKILRSTAPDGITAGDVPLWLTGSGTDLSMLVVSWAQLGYLRIQIEEGGRVLLHKRMEMGNERSAFENRIYNKLFGRRLTVDGTGEHYARMVCSVKKGRGRAREVYRPNSGNPYIFRALCALAALLSGISMASAFSPNSVFLAILLAVMSAVMAWLIQSGACGLLQRDKLQLWIALGCAGLWLILGIWSGVWLMGVLMLAFQFFAGLMTAYGGKRTDLGQMGLTQLLGLRKFLCSASKQELQRLVMANPGYFHDLMPYALALGVGRIFAVRFGRTRIPECAYLITDARSQMTAIEWATTLHKAVDALDAKARRMPLDRLMGK